MIGFLRNDTPQPAAFAFEKSLIGFVRTDEARAPLDLDAAERHLTTLIGRSMHDADPFEHDFYLGHGFVVLEQRSAITLDKLRDLFGVNGPNLRGLAEARRRQRRMIRRWFS